MFDLNLKCKFFEGQKDAYDLILWLVFLFVITIGVLGLILYKKTKKIIRVVTNNRMVNVQMLNNTSANGKRASADGASRRNETNNNMPIQLPFDDVWAWKQYLSLYLEKK